MFSEYCIWWVFQVFRVLYLVGFSCFQSIPRISSSKSAGSMTIHALEACLGMEIYRTLNRKIDDYFGILARHSHTYLTQWQSYVFYQYFPYPSSFETSGIPEKLHVATELNFLALSFKSGRLSKNLVTPNFQVEL